MESGYFLAAKTEAEVMFENLKSDQKYSFRHIKNLATHSSGLSLMIEKLRITKIENPLKVLRGYAVTYTPFGIKKID
ncbi:MAG: hypothetical protein SGJ02_12175 [bacterium]|nr:hypothetical protein [bacterium]